MIDKQTAQNFQRAQTASQRKGTSLMEELDAMGLLITHGKDRSLEYAALDLLLQELEVRGPSQLMRMTYGRVHGSPKDMFEAVMGFITSYVSSKKV